MSIPIIFIHYGDSDYLKYSLMQAKKSNPQSDVMLIGYRINERYDLARHENITDYDESAKDFAKYYVHLSPNGYDYELFCFQRWFILRDFLKKNKIRKCFYIDSDVLLFENVSKMEFEHAYCSSGGHSSMNTPAGLENFCAFIKEHYREPSFVEYMKNLFHQSGNRRNIGDMFFFRLYAQQFPDRVHNLSEIHNQAIFGPNINKPKMFEEWQGRKKVYIINGNPCSKHLPSNQWIRFNSLHFQGSAKQYMEYFSTFFPQERITFFDYETCRWIVETSQNEQE